MSSPKGRTVYKWSTPVRALLKCLAVRLWDEGIRGEALVREFRRRFPDWKSAFGGNIADNTLIQRADKCRRYPSEAPETHEDTKEYWELSGGIIKAGDAWKVFELEAALPGAEAEMPPPCRTTVCSEGSDLLQQIQKLESVAAEGRFYITARALNQAKNTLGWEMADNMDMAAKAARGERPK